MIKALLLLIGCAAALLALVLAAWLAPTPEARRQARVVLAAVAITFAVVSTILGGLVTVALWKGWRDEVATHRYYEEHISALYAWKVERGVYPETLEELGLGLPPPALAEGWGYRATFEGTEFVIEVPGLTYTSIDREWYERGS